MVMMGNIEQSSFRTAILSSSVSCKATDELDIWDTIVLDVRSILWVAKQFVSGLAHKDQYDALCSSEE